MKPKTKILLGIVIVLVIIVAGLIYWQSNKKRDYCGVVSKEIIEEDNPSFNIIKENCEKIPSCEWEGLGGKIIGHYACCPKNLHSPEKSLEYWPESVRNRCFIFID